VLYTLIQDMVELSSGRGALMQGVVCTLKQDMVELSSGRWAGLLFKGVCATAMIVSIFNCKVFWQLNLMLFH